VHSVIVDVSVTQANKPVAGLTAADFEVLDRGVPQKISDVSVEAVPIDLTMVLDVSLSVTGGLLDQLRAGVRRIAASATPRDRLRLLTFSHRILRPVDLGDSALAIEEAVDRLSANGSTSAFDALVVAFTAAAEPGRRRLVVLFSDGRDTTSFLDEGPVLSVASRAQSVAFVIVATRAAVAPRVESLPHGPFFQRLAETTGGRVVPIALGKQVSDGFLEAVDEFRRSYVLRYTPTGVDLAGWHDLTVRVTRPGRFDVRARRGYFGR
jgi:Ca-activated chloride channel family protein